MRATALLLPLVLGLACAHEPANQEASQPHAPAPGGPAAGPGKEDVAPERASGFRKVAAVHADRFVVTSAHPLASDAGVAVLRAGGSALDATVAVQAMLTLVEPQSSGVGGGAFLLYYDAAADRLIAWDGREVAPRAARPDRFLDEEGKPVGFLNALVGGKSVGVPGVMRMLDEAHRAHGKLPWKDLFTSSIARAEAGFPVSPRLRSSLERDPIKPLPPAMAAYFLDERGAPRAEGSLLKNPELAQSLRQIAEQGADALYAGPLAQAIVDAVRSAERNPGDLTLEDLAAYRPVAREPVCLDYRGREVCGFPPPTSGGTTVLATLGVLEHFRLDADPLSARNAHLLAEAERLAYADRGRYLGDPAFVDVPVAGLLDDTYLAQRAALVQEDRALGEVPVGEPPGHPSSRAPDRSPELPSTSHFVVVDEAGNVACMTTSVEFVFGSHLMAGGFILNNQLTDFSFVPEEDGRPVANALAAGKRPRSSMAPTVVFERPEGQRRRPLLALGSPGGSRIIGYVAQALVGVLDHGLDVQQAIELPHVLDRGAQLELEDLPGSEARLAALAEALRARGHDVVLGEQNSGLHGVQWKDGKLLAGADPRREGLALGE